MPMSMKGAGYRMKGKPRNYPSKQLKGTFHRNKRLPNTKVISAMKGSGK